MSDIKYYFDGTNGKHVNGEISVSMLISGSSLAGQIASLPFTYSDRFFENSACSYNHELAKMSLGMSMSAFTANVGGDKYIRNLLHTIGCDDRTVETEKFCMTDTADDSCGYAFGAKRLGSGEYLIIVTIRSHRYGGEWVSNAHVVDEGCPDYATGFKAAADIVFDALCDYISRRGFDKKRLKIWISGFSRGAAVSNLLGARLSFESGIGKDNIFVYTFAAPLTVFDRAAKFTDNIFNIISEIDAVPRVPLASWGLVRYGTDLYLPCPTRRGEAEYEKLLFAMRERFDDIMTRLGISGIEYKPIEQQEIALDLLFDYLDDLLTTPEKYASGGYQGIIMEYMKSMFTGGEFEPKTFLSFLLDGNDELAEDLCSLIENWDELGALEKVQRISKLPQKRRQGEKTPASELISMGLGILVRYAAKLTATKVTHGEQDFYYEQLVTLLVDAYRTGADSAILMQHWPEVYLAWLESAGENTLYRTTSYCRKSVK